MTTGEWVIAGIVSVILAMVFWRRVNRKHDEAVSRQREAWNRPLTDAELRIIDARAKRFIKTGRA